MRKIFSSIDKELDDFLPAFSKRGMDLSLDRIKKALKELGEPCKYIPAIHIAGTNGKGSIVSFLESTLSSSGIKTGVTTSPHLISWSERIRVDGKLISIKELRNQLVKLSNTAEKYSLTTFEFLICAALDYFSMQKVDLLILEVGLGGRLDATTAHAFRPLICMASIGLDHCEYLGHDLAKIAAEKASIINPGSKIISCEQEDVVAKVLEAKTIENHAQLHWVNPLPSYWQLGIKGDIQRQNAAVAKKALEELNLMGFSINEEMIKIGFKNANWPARMQKIVWKQKTLLLDCAHNPPATENLAKERNQWRNESYGICWILGIQAHKAAPEMIRNLIRSCDTACIVPIPGYKSWTKNEISKVCPQLNGQLVEFNDVESYLNSLLLKGSWPKTHPVIVGSIYLVGDFLSRNNIKI